MQNQFQLQGILSYISDVTKGTSKSGKDWQKLEIVIATEGEYSKDVHFTIFGEEKVKTFLELNKTGRKVNVFFNVESRAWNDKWYTQLNAWKVENVENTDNNTKAMSTAEVDDLPF
tara:strand:+ start:2443 stop:2790 length:348 start_codon:yes stop_codon:yes gene_type:complete